MHPNPLGVICPLDTCVCVCLRESVPVYARVPFVYMYSIHVYYKMLKQTLRQMAEEFELSGKAMSASLKDLLMMNLCVNGGYFHNNGINAAKSIISIVWYIRYSGNV